MSFIIALVIAYLLGSISSAIITAKCMKLPDPRQHGSRNPGATNVLRSGGKKAAIIVLVGDALKGLIAVLIGRLLHLEGMALGFIALAAVIGHMFPLYFKFQGGKGVATALGSILALSFGVGILVIVIWVVIASMLRYSSIASMSSIIAALILLIIVGDSGYAFPMLVMVVLIIWKHWANIDRLRKGTEGKIKL